MALAKRQLIKEENIDPAMKNDDHSDSIKRKKRINRDVDDPHIKDNFLPQKKRTHGPAISHNLRGFNNNNNNNNNNNTKTNDDQDDETLIRETQAALKSLSGSWPDSRLYKINDQDENPPFQNLFEEKHHDQKMSPTSSTHHTINGLPLDPHCNLKDTMALRDCNGKFKSDARLTQKIKNSGTDSKDKSSDSISQYQPPDFNELVDDSSNDLEIDMDDKEGRKRSEAKVRRDDPYPGYPKAQFSQVSAFKPPSELRKNGITAMPGPLGVYSVEPTYIGYPEPQTTMSTPLSITGYSVESEKQPIKIKVEESTAKSIGSPDSKQYTILQPAGVGSRAASVMQDIAREGVVSVSAVSSSSSPGIGIVSSSTMGHLNEKITFDRTIPALSPGSINRGKALCF